MAGPCDVIVVGGGPAGAAAALRMAGAGRSVTVLERTRFDRPRVGETLAPGVWPLLHDLGVWSDFLRLEPLESWGTRSIWNDPTPAEHSHLASGYGCGWHIDRRAFDRMLAGAAARAGAQVRTNTSVVGCRHDGVSWNLQCADGRTFSGRLVMDATGRRAGISRCLGARRVPFDRLVAIATCWGDVDITDQQYLLVESTADGWWYTAPLPATGMVGMLVTDADLCRLHGLSGTARFDGKLHEAASSAARVRGASSRTAPRVHSAASHRVSRSSDVRPWLSVGDAALAVDPITGTGVLRALRAGKAAADTAQLMLEQPGDVAPLVAEYESALDGDCTSYLTDRARCYGSVRRYVSPFWARRKPRITP